MDAAESGDRELSGEWVVGRNVWKRLKAERFKDAVGEGSGESLRRGSFRGSRSRDVSSQRESVVTSVTPSTTKLGRSLSLTTDAEARNRKRKTTEKMVYYIHGGGLPLGFGRDAALY